MNCFCFFILRAGEAGVAESWNYVFFVLVMLFLLYDVPGGSLSFQS